MQQETLSRFQPTFRADEIRLIMSLARQGESLGFVGVAGVGKSNIINYLRDRRHDASQLEQNMPQLHFPIVDASHWQGTAQSLWQMMLAALQQVAGALTPPAGTNKIISISEEERTLQALQRRLNWLCQETGYRIMFVLDDFDAVIETGPLAMLEQLDNFRHEGNQESLSYLIFTTHLPHLLGAGYDLEQQSRFYDLFRHRIYALEPYTPEDAMHMLKHFNDVAGRPLDDSHLEQIYQLAGGHARLLKVVFNIWITKGASGIKTTYFAAQLDIQHECRRILTSLHAQEQRVALRLARGQQTATDQPIVDHLLRRGLLEKSEPPVWFSPLFEQFLRTVEISGALA